MNIFSILDHLLNLNPIKFITRFKVNVFNGLAPKILSSKVDVLYFEKEKINAQNIIFDVQYLWTKTS